MSGLADDSLLELFREEVRGNVQTLNDGLVALEQDPANRPLIEPLMRAAHSIKGAARAVGVEPAVKVAHAAEDCLVAAQEGRIALSSDDVDVLLRAVDSLDGITDAAGPNLPQWLAEHGEGVDALTEQLLAIARKEPGEAPVEAGTPTSLPQGPPGRRPTPAAAQSIAAPLLDLFRSEVGANVQIVVGGLAALERDPADPRLVDPLIEAAHAIAGSARLVGVAPAVDVASSLETCLSRLRKGPAEVSGDAIALLSRAAEVLTKIAEAAGPEISEWLSAHETEIGDLVEKLQSVPEVEVAEASSAAAREVVASSAAGPKGAPADSVEQVVRVTAQSLTRLMGLAGESLVEARWLQPFSKSLLELKREQTLLADALEELNHLLPVDEATDRQRALTADARARLTDCRRMLSDRISEFENRARHADDLNSRLYHEVIASRMRPFRDGVQGFPRMVRDLARELDKKVAFEVRGETTDVDRDILEKLEAPLNHILRNAVDHALEPPADRSAAGKPETCRLSVEARHNAGMLVILVTDDGRGIDVEKIRSRVIERQLADARMAREMSDSELLDFLFLPGFSTADGVTEVSGRGVGLDVVHSMVQSVGGNIRVHTERGQGTTFQLELPITLSVIRAVLVKIAGEPYAFPHNRIDRLIRLPRTELSSLENRQHFDVDGRNVGVVLARQVLELEAEQPKTDGLFVILFSNHSHQYGLLVDEFCGERDLVVRPLDPRLGKVPNSSGRCLTSTPRRSSTTARPC
ncbi:MAG: chemotaxis protein CheA [Planctomycetota bacterium]|jgi:two-component system sensor histidine kinase and response regulator WspE